MISIDTWAVIAADEKNLTLECPWQEGNPWNVPVEWFGYDEGHGFCVGDILSTETGGLDYLEYEELNDLTEEGRTVFWEYIKRKGFRYTDLEKYGFIADRTESG